MKKLLKNCEVCNKVFAHPTRTLCDECYREAQARFQAVKDFLQKNPGASVAEVAEATETEIEVIYEYIREGRLSVIPKDAGLACELCGAPIPMGRVCQRCLGRLEQMTRGGEKQEPGGSSPTDSKVRYLDQIRRQR